ncbi:hypothetical protein [Saccharothrix deserti]|uniref:hypothetical protein n=1 Tax=Saccharothrix deserti TaxID=2593674 RepID=UPI00131C794E|nr:hypothetical protein [Saccharothrix deserti]
MPLLEDADPHVREGAYGCTAHLTSTAVVAEVAARLAGALARVLPGAPERTPETCDAIARIADDASLRMDGRAQQG